RLEAIEADVKRKSPESPLLAYVAYRRMLADYSNRLQESEPEKRQDVQKWWISSLGEYIQEYPDGEDTPDAMLQLAITEEFSGRLKEALEWYHKLAKDDATTGAAARA